MLAQLSLSRSALRLTWQLRLLVLVGVVGAAALALLFTFQLVQGEAAAGAAMICGSKFNDLNGDGVWDGTLEPTLPGWTIGLEGGAQFTQTVTDANGNYCFTDLVNGSYFVFEVMQPGWEQTYPNGPHQVIIEQGQSVLNIHFGNHQPAGIFGRKFWDQDGNGSHEAGEPALPNWQIYLTGTGINSSTLTNALGRYSFSGLLTGTYTVTEQVVVGWVQTLPVSPTTYYTVTYVPFQVADDLDFGNYVPQLGQIGGMKFHDVDGDGVKDNGEPGLVNWEIHIEGSYYTSATLTNDQGQYGFAGLPPDTYTVYESVPAPFWNGQTMVQWNQTYPVSATYEVELDAGEVVGGLDFGNWQGGKSDFCMIPWDNHFLNQNYLDTEVYIFNTSPEPQKVYSMTLVGPSNFTILTPMPITLNPNQYGTVAVRVYYPAVFNAPYQSAIFQAIVTNLSQPPSSFSCTAALWSYSPQWWTSPNVNSGLSGGIPFGFTQNISFTVSNNSGGVILEAGDTVSYTIMAMSRGMGNGSIVSLNGLPAGTGIEGLLTIPPGGTADIPVEVAFTENNLLAPTDVVFSLDVDGDGQADTMTSHLVILQPSELFLPLVLKP